MNCSQANDLLSAYYDGELPPREAAAVATHLANCSSCANALASFKEMSQLASQLRQPVSASSTWSDIEQQLDTPTPLSGAIHRPTRWRQWIPAAAIAATLLIAMTAALSVRFWGNADERIAEKFDDFLQQYSQDPSAAQRVLIASYDGRRVNLDDAAGTIGYMPAAINLTPDGYAVQDIYLLHMPSCQCGQSGCKKHQCTQDATCPCGGSCKCAQVVYRNANGRLLSIFEQDTPQPAWFGNRPAVKCECSGVSTEIVQLDAQQLAASWKHGSRYLTVVGAENLEEVKHIMEHLQAASESSAAGHET